MRNWSCLLVYLILLFAPWAFGATELWSLTTIQLLTALATVVTAISLVRTPASHARQSAAQWGWAVPMLALTIYIGLQAANASHRYQWLDESLFPQQHVSWLPHSVDAGITWQALGKFLTYAALFWIVRVCFTDPLQWKRLLNVLVGSGFVMALFGILQSSSGTQRIFWVRAPQTFSEFFGPFVNPNNYASYMNLLIPVALTLGRHAQRAGPTRRHKSHPGYLFYFIAAVMIASVFLSRSRGGMILCFGLVAGWLLLECLSIKAVAHRDARALLWSLGLLVAVSAGLLCYLGLGPVERELVTLRNVSDDFSGLRVIVYRTTFDMFRDRWLYGIGAGAFQYAFPYYQPDFVSDFWRYAHSDWLQYLSELGVVGSLLLAAFGLGALWPAVRSRGAAARNHQGQPAQYSFRRHLAWALALGLVATAVHSAIDFPLRIPGVATLAGTYFALLSTYSLRL